MTPNPSDPPSPSLIAWRLLRIFSLLALLAVIIGIAPIGLPLRAFGWCAAFACAWWLSRHAAQCLLQPVQRAEETTRALEQCARELTSQQSQAQAILESMVEGVVALDRQGRILWLNGSAQRLFSVQPDQAAGRRLLEFFRQPELDGLIQEALTERRPAVREVRVFSPKEQVFRFQAAPCEGGEMAGSLVLVAQEVTEIRRLEGARREFVANVSHELKSPLTSIKGLVETLLSGALEDPANNRRFLSLIDEDATRLGRLIDDLLELSQIESRAEPPAQEAVALAPLVAEVVASLGQEIRQRRLSVSVELDPDLRVIGDPRRLRQVFVNLLDNAVKYNTEGGSVTVTASREADRLKVMVADTGIGVPEPDLPRLFERFYRVDKARSRALGGTGLGLSIVKHIVERHGGSVSVESRLGAGSTFSLTLPLAGLQ